MDNFIGKIVTQFTETQENFMFETIYPFCKEVTKCEISKEELTNALLFWGAITKEHKTNGDMIKALFPKLRVDVFGDSIQVMGQNYEFRNEYPLIWWNAPYKAESEGKRNE